MIANSLESLRRMDLVTHLTADLYVLTPGTMAGTFELLHTASVIGADVPAKMRTVLGFRDVAVHS